MGNLRTKSAPLSFLENGSGSVIISEQYI